HYAEACRHEKPVRAKLWGKSGFFLMPLDAAGRVASRNDFVRRYFIREDTGMTLSTFYTLGGSGLRITRLALGTMTFGDGSAWTNDEETSRAQFDRYLEAGGNLIDTADVYTAGVSEMQVGKFVKERGVRDQVVIATKFTHNRAQGN